MAAINRPTEATYVIHDEVSVQTTDNEDHTFCGVMFPIKCKNNLPLIQVIVKSIAVRGRLGPLTVWVSNNNNNNSEDQSKQFRMNPRYWTKVYEKKHMPSYSNFCTLDFAENPIILKPGQVRAIYIHSTLESDEAIVYDNNRHRRTYNDSLISILTGRAHVSTTVFGSTPIWGWGNAWRDQREFVGRIEYGAVYKLWNPSQAMDFGSKFQSLVRCLHLCQRRWESPMSKLPDDCIFYILNMCRWDWVNDTPEEMKSLKMKRKATEKRQNDQTASFPVAAVLSLSSSPARSTSSNHCISPPWLGVQHSNNENTEEDNEEEYHDAVSVEILEEGNNSSEDDDGDYIDEDEAMSEDDDDDDVYDDDDGYNANSAVFRYHDDSDDDEDENGANGENQTRYTRSRQAWLRRTFARIHVLQALADLEDDDDAAPPAAPAPAVEMNFD